MALPPSDSPACVLYDALEGFRAQAAEWRLGAKIARNRAADLDNAAAEEEARVRALEDAIETLTGDRAWAPAGREDSKGPPDAPTVGGGVSDAPDRMWLVVNNPQQAMDWVADYCRRGGSLATVPWTDSVSDPDVTVPYLATDAEAAAIFEKHRARAERPA